MTTGVLLTPPIVQFFGNNGQPAVNGSVLTQVGGVNTATFQDSALTTPLPNPIPLNSRGEVSSSNGVSSQCFLTPNIVYVFTLFDSVGTQLWTATYVNGIQLTQATIGQALYPLTAAEAAASITPSSFAYPPLNPWRYGADGAGGANDAGAYANVNAVIAQISTAILGWKNGLAVPGYPKSTLELTPTGQSVLPQNYSAVSGEVGWMSVFRFLTEAQIKAVQSGTNTVDISAAVQAANDYLEGSAGGSIATLGTLTGGSGYTNGTYLDVVLTGGHGINAAANITVSGGAVTVANLAQIGSAYQIGDVLSAPAASIGGTGSGFSIPVATLRSITGKTINGLQGGVLYFPSGFYYFGTTTMRIGGNVRWIGSQTVSTSFNWASGYTGNGLQFGPDLSGFYGFSGYYTMQTALEQVLVNMSVGQAFGIYCTGGQQGCYIKHVIVNGVGANATGIFYQDLKGAAYFRMEDIEIIGGTGCNSSNTIGISAQGAACFELIGCSVNGIGTGTGRMFQGLALSGNGGFLIMNYDSELNVTGIDLTGTGFPTCSVDTMSVNPNCTQGIWVHSTYPGAVTVRNIGGGNPTIIVRNDATGYNLSSGTDNFIPLYCWSGGAVASGLNTSVLEQVIISEVLKDIVDVSHVFTPDVGIAAWILCIIVANAAYTIANPVYCGGTMPAALAGRRITLTLFGNGNAPASITFGTAWKVIAPSPLPGSSSQIAADFRWDGAHWYQITPWTGQVPN